MIVNILTAFLIATIFSLIIPSILEGIDHLLRLLLSALESIDKLLKEDEYIKGDKK